MPASTEVKRLTLRKLADDAVCRNATLAATLRAAAFATVTGTLSSKVLTATSTSGTSVTYTLPQGASALQPQEIAAMQSQLLDLYDAAVLANSGTPTDGELLAWMLGQLVPLRCYSTSFAGTLLGR